MPRHAQACPVGTNCPGNMACGYRPHFWEQDTHFWTQEPLLGGFSVVIAKLAIYIAKIAKLAVFSFKNSQKWRLLNLLSKFSHFWTQGPLLRMSSLVIARLVILHVQKSPNWRFLAPKIAKVATFE